MIRVFVSSRMTPDELQQERKLVIEALRILGAIPIAFECEPAAAQHWREWWRERIPKCDAFVVILDRTIGEGVLDEVLVARDCQVPSFVFARDIDGLWKKRLSDEGVRESSDRDERIARFYNCVTSPKASSYGSPEHLASQVSGAIGGDERLRKRLFGNLERLRAVFVPPSGYVDWAARLKTSGLLILAGPPHVGKTASAARLLLDVLERDDALRFHQFRGPAQHESVSGCQRAAILWDDCFGLSLAVDGSETDEVVETLAELATHAADRCVVATTREDVYEALVAGGGRLAEAADRLPLERISAASAYSLDALRAILERHLQWSRGQGDVDEAQQALAWAHADAVCRELTFPHNIQIFCSAKLPGVVDDATFREAVAASKEIQKAVQSWASGLDDREQLLGVLLCLFGDVDHKMALDLAQRAHCKWAAQLDSQEHLRRACSIYLASEAGVGPQHPSYAEAVITRAGDLPQLGIAALDAMAEFEWLRVHSEFPLAHLCAHLLSSPRATQEQKRTALDDGLGIVARRSGHHGLLRELIRAWRPDAAPFYSAHFAHATAEALWDLGRMLVAARGHIPQAALEQFQLLLIAKPHASRTAYRPWPDSDKTSPYESVFADVAAAPASVLHLLDIQSQASPELFAIEYARDIIAHQSILGTHSALWLSAAVGGHQCYGYTARERIWFAIAEHHDRLPEQARERLAAAATSTKAHERIPALRAIWRHRAALPSDVMALLTDRLGTGDPAVIDAIMRPADWWQFPRKEFERLLPNVGDGELAVIAECAEWARHNRQAFDSGIVSGVGPVGESICEGLKLHRRFRQNREDAMAALQHPNPCAQLSALVCGFCVEPDCDAALSDRTNELARCFATLPEPLKCAAIVEIMAQEPKLPQSVAQFAVACGVVGQRQWFPSFDAAARLARAHQSPRERIYPAYPTLYLALLRRNEPVQYRDCIVARLRGRSTNLM